MLGFDGGDGGVLHLRVRSEVHGARGFTCEGRAPDVEVAAAMRGDKLVLGARNPLETGHAGFVYGALRLYRRERERKREREQV